MLYLYFVPFIGFQIKYDDDDDEVTLTLTLSLTLIRATNCIQFI